jgi:hypothetical protein
MSAINIDVILKAKFYGWCVGNQQNVGSWVVLIIVFGMWEINKMGGLASCFSNYFWHVENQQNGLFKLNFLACGECNKACELMSYLSFLFGMWEFNKMFK